MTTPPPTIYPGPLPKPFDPARAARTFATLGEGDDPFAPDGAFRALLESLFGNSPYLARLALRERALLRQAATELPRTLLDAICADALAAAHDETAAAAMTRLRRAKARAALLIAMADLSGVWPVMQVTAALSAFADAAVTGALRFALKEMAVRTGFAVHDPAGLEAETGLTVLAMGKYGALELNYSSDVDFIVFYDAEKFPFRVRDDKRAAAVEIVKTMVRLLSETTTAGYVFRVDLRLRPDAGATQIAISTDAAEHYYEAMGQNWERAAMIKARACAGDPETGQHFLKAMEPFIWRKNLDFAAIEDIHSIKRQIHAHEGHSKIAVAGHNIKLGRGGIREIEFFVQTQQLILGGRNPDLRGRATLETLAALAARGLIAKETEVELRTAYLFLRELEHRLQMVEDQQTHTLPKSEEELDHIACFMGFADTQAFTAAVTQCLQTVSGHYRRLFEREAPLAAQSGSLVFTGVEEDPQTLETLAGMGFRAPAHVSAAIRGWHHGRVRAVRGERARERLTALVPALLEALSKTADPDGAFAQFDRFLSRLPSSVQLFSLLLANPHFLNLVAEIAGSTPRVAMVLSGSPGTLDALLDPGFMGELPSRKRLDSMLSGTLAGARDFEDALDLTRRFAREQNFRVSVQVIDGAATAEEAGPAFTHVADCVLSRLFPVVENELAQSAGRIPGGNFAVIAMGKLGGREMTASSDLDLVFVYDAPDDVEASDGEKALAVPLYYARLAQRFIAALTAHTAQGGLYDVDMRLRPTGNKGPVAVSLESFRRYHADDSWTWEHLALTRARVVHAPVALAEKVEAIIHATLTKPSDPAILFRDAREMREKLAAQFPGRNTWDLKYTRGGMIDIEFAVQTLQLRDAHHSPEILHTNTIAALENLARAGSLAKADAEGLIAAAHLQNALMQTLRIAIDGVLDPGAATEGLKTLLARIGGAPDFGQLTARLAAAQATARAAYEKIMATA